MKLTLVWVGCVSLLVGACGGNSSSPQGTGGGMSATGGTGSQASGGATDAGGTPNGDGGSVGGSGVSGGTGGQGNGGSASGGEGGSAPLPPGTAVLGSECATPGELACAGTFQKVSLVCSASLLWENNETCEGAQVCDTREGLTRGSCQEQAPECLDKTAGYQGCSGATAQSCSVDNTEYSDTECERGCVSGTCNQSAPICPDPNSDFSNCAGDCDGGEPCSTASAGCSFVFASSHSPQIRVPGLAELCDYSSCGKAFMIQADGSSARITGTGWKFQAHDWEFQLGQVRPECNIAGSFEPTCIAVPSGTLVYAVPEGEHVEPSTIYAVAEKDPTCE